MISRFASARCTSIATATTSRKYLAICQPILAPLSLARLALTLAGRIRNPTQLRRTHGLRGDVL